jgi:hypothetical protein
MHKKYYKDYRLDRGEYARKNGYRKKNIIRDSKNITSSRHYGYMDINPYYPVFFIPNIFINE